FLINQCNKIWTLISFINKCKSVCLEWNNDLIKNVHNWTNYYNIGELIYSELLIGLRQRINVNYMVNETYNLKDIYYSLIGERRLLCAKIFIPIIKNNVILCEQNKIQINYGTNPHLIDIQRIFNITDDLSNNYFKEKSYK